MDVNLLVFLKDSIYRVKILKALEKKSMLSSELALKLNVNRASMSRMLKLLKEKDLIFSNSNKTRTILYSISEKGKKIIGELND